MIDPDDPGRTFSFLLQVDDQDDCYRVEDCEPALSALLLRELEDELNSSDDMMAFCMGIRQAFEDTLV